MILRDQKIELEQAKIGREEAPRKVDQLPLGREEIQRKIDQLQLLLGKI